MPFTDDVIFKGLRGKVGDFVFKRFGGRTLMTKAPAKPRVESQLQKIRRNHFRLASAWAKLQLRDESKHKQFQKIAKERNLPNAYTAAIQEYLKSKDSPGL